MEGINDTYHRHAKIVFKIFNNKNIGDNHDLYAQSDTLLLEDVLEKFRNMCIKEYELDPAYFWSLPGLAWLACLKKTKIKLELLTDNGMLLIIEKGIRGGITHAINKTC